MAQADGGRVQALLRSEDKVLRRWVEAAEVPLRGRLTTGELERTCSDLLTVLVEAAAGGGLDVTSDAYAGARGFLAELSRDWARRGFSPSETASAVFALKDALFAAADEDGEGGGDLPTVLEASRWVDALGLVTFESFARAREQVISEQAEQ